MKIEPILGYKFPINDLVKWYEDHKHLLIELGPSQKAFSIQSRNGNVDSDLFRSDGHDWLSNKPTIAYNGPIKTILEFFPKAYRARIICLGPGFSYKFHSDHPTHVRYHVPIITNEGCFFEYEEGYARHMPADGRIWRVETFYRHRFLNLGKEDRIHLVFGINPDDEVK